MKAEDETREDGERKKVRQIKWNKGQTKGKRISEGEKGQVKEKRQAGVEVMIGRIKGRERT